MRIVIVSIISLFFLPLFRADVHAEFKKTKIAVLDFKLQGENFETKDLGKIVSEWLITAFVREGRFEVIERKLLGQVLEEQKMVEAGVVSQETASEIGKLLGVKVIISGSVMKLKDVVEVNARIIDVASGSIITAESVSSKDVTSLNRLVKEMAQIVIKNFPLEGYVVHRQNDNVVIDLGRRSGVKPGMYFLAYKEGEVVKHPKTGEILYVTQNETGIIKIVSVEMKISNGIILQETNPDAINYGDLVKSSIRERLPQITKKSTPQPSMAERWIQEDTPEKHVVQKQALKQPDQTTDNSSFSRLYVDTFPQNATVRILNIQEKYRDGMNLPAGKYQVEVSAPNYSAYSAWYDVKEDQDLRLTITLKAVVQQPVPPSLDPEIKKHIDMLWSQKSRELRNGAMHLHKKYRQNKIVIQAAYDVLEARYNEHQYDTDHIDAMAYLCNIIGYSGKEKHRELLNRIAQTTSVWKLRSYAEDNLAKKVASTGKRTQTATISKNYGSLSVNTIPTDATVRILNDDIRYHDRISLPGGKYHVEVSAVGYLTERAWYNLKEGENRRFTVILQPSAQAPLSPTQSADVKKNLELLRAKKSSLVRQAAMFLYKNYKHDQVVIRTAHEVLAASYNEHLYDSEHIDAMAYLCNILGDSGQKNHRELLGQIARKTSIWKLKSYAKDNLAKKITFKNRISPPQKRSYKELTGRDPRASLHIETVPANATIRLPSSGISYYDGIKLSGGGYQIEISAPGYQTDSSWYLLKEGENRSFTVVLQPSSPVYADSAKTSYFKKYFDMLHSEDSGKVREGAMYLYKNHAQAAIVIETAAKVLQTRYKEKDDFNHIDAMAYLCNILGSSGKLQYRKLLKEVSKETSSWKLSFFADKNRYLLSK